MSALDLALNPLALVFDVRVGARGIEFTLFRFFVVGTLAFEKIESVEKKWTLEQRKAAYRFVNRWIARRFMINSNALYARYLLVSPPDADRFESELKQRGVAIKP